MRLVHESASLAASLAFVLAAGAATRPLLTPPPRHLAWSGAALRLPEPCPVVATGAAEQQVARILQHEMLRLHQVRVSVVQKAPVGHAHILLALTSTPDGAAGVARTAGRALWHSHENRPEAYLLEVNRDRALILSKSPRGLLYGMQTLLQLVEPVGPGPARQIDGVSIVDYPQLAFRGLHICLFPDSELETVRREILMAARYKYNAIVLEIWASLKSKKWPQTAYEHAYAPAQVRSLVELGRALEMEMIPALNSWGHQSGMRFVSGEHVVLDRFPEMKDLFEPGGWSLCLSNQAIYPLLFDRYHELIELFDHPRYFHVGMDEAWGFRGYTPCPRCRNAEPHQLIEAHIRKIYQYFAGRQIRILMWHDMFVRRNDPDLGPVSPANSLPPVNSYLALSAVPKDVIIDAWNYSEAGQWPVPKYFQDRGYPVVVSPWKSKANTISLIETAKKLNLLGMLTTTWDSQDVILPCIGQAGVLSWTEPGSDLQQIPFDYWLTTLRELPISRLPSFTGTSRKRVPGGAAPRPSPRQSQS